MTKLPRDLSGEELIRRLSRLGYRVVRQHGSHVALVDEAGQPCFVPRHQAIKPGTLGDVLKKIAQQQGLALRDLLKLLVF